MPYRLLTAALDPGARLGLAGPGARCFLALGTALLATLAMGGPAIRLLRRVKAGERTEKTPIEDEELRRRIASKSGTPTMGGIVVVLALSLACLLWADLSRPAVQGALGVVGFLALVGMTDDWLKLRGAERGDRGLKARYKLAAQAVAGGALALLLTSRGGGPTSVPFLRLTGALGVVLFAAWAMALVAGMSNGVNITDGLDGLVPGLVPMVGIALAGACWGAGAPAIARRLGIAPVAGAGEAAVFCSALSGACLGFLAFNRHPARVFLGDTGSLALGGGLAAAALAVGQEMVLLVAGLVFVFELGSSLLQIFWFKLFRRRILPVAPLHHIFEQRGDPEPAIVRSFYLWCAVAVLLGVNLMGKI